MKPRILIVEDEKPQLENIRYELETIPSKKCRELKIDRFHFDLAISGKKAEAFLESSDSPYDILLLDMSFPFREGEASSPDNGLRLLQFARDRRAAKEIIIVSVFSDYAHTISAFRRGAVDFLAKPYSREMLQVRVLESWKRILEKETAYLLEERIRELDFYAEHGFARTFNARFSNLVQLMIDSVANIEEHIHERYGLSRKTGANDYLIRCLTSQRETLHRARDEWINLQSTFLSARSIRSEIVERLLYDICQIVQPCLSTKGLKLKIPKTRGVPVLTFQDDVRAVLKEIVVGALSELPEYPNVSNRIEIDVGISNGQAKVRFIDDLTSMDADDIQRINTGGRVAPGQRFRRAWGLSIMQNIALYGGGHLEVEPRNVQGNVITYLIPLADS